MLRVGLLWPWGSAWLGGANYFRNLIHCYHKYPDSRLKLEVFSGDVEGVKQYVSDAISIHRCPQMLNLRRNLPARVFKKFWGYDPVLLRLMERHQIELLTHSGVGRQTRINTLPWHGDLQHKKYPQYFTEKAMAIRDSIVDDAALCGNVLFSSHAAVCDFRKYYPHLSSVKTHVLHFSTAGVLEVAPLGREELESRYPVGEPYFLLPNQFWMHKNHTVVVDALRYAPDNIRVLCTGWMSDTRDPSYVPGLMEKVRREGLEGRFLCLGTIPYADLVSLMHHSIAVVQPSLFEGWSTSVEEAKAMRKQILLSSIDVHLEQAPERGVYFPPDSPEELAACLTRAYEEFSSEVEAGFAETRLQFKETIERVWVEDFARILKSVAGLNPSTN